MIKTYYPKLADLEHNWFLVDAENQNLGRLCTQIAHRLRGKHKVVYTPGADTGDYIVVINAEKIKVTGNKLKDKFYYRQSGTAGGLKQINLADQLKKHPERVLQHGVKGMLPRGPLGRKLLKKMRVFAGSEHEHTAQKPQKLVI